jgi:hypothetical protein
MAGAKPTMRSRSESTRRLETLTPAAMMAVMAAPKKHAPTTHRKFPSVRGPCNPGTPRPLVISRSSQAEKNSNQAAQHRSTRDRARESVCWAGSVMGNRSLIVAALQSRLGTARPTQPSRKARQTEPMRTRCDMGRYKIRPSSFEAACNSVSFLASTLAIYRLRVQITNRLTFIGTSDERPRV